MQITKTIEATLENKLVEARYLSAQFSVSKNKKQKCKLRNVKTERYDKNDRLDWKWSLCGSHHYRQRAGKVSTYRDLDVKGFRQKLI